MALSKIFGWLLIAAAAAACATVAWLFVELLVSDPGRDPMPVVIDRFGWVYVFLLGVVLAGIGYVVCRVLRV